MANPSPDKGNAPMEEQRTYMTEEQAERWAWEQVKRDVGTEGWTAGDSCNYFGFFLWGWRYRAQYLRQRATPPSPSTAPKVPPFPEALTLADVDYAIKTPANWDPDYRRTWQQLQVAQATIRELRAYARQLRALASRPAEVDDEGLPNFPAPAAAWMVGRNLYLHHDAIPAGLLPPIGNPEPLFSVKQYRKGQRDAVAADRARREKGGA